MPPPDYDATGIENSKIHSFKFVSGETLPINIAYRSYNPSSTKKACIPTCYGGRINTTTSYTSADAALSSHHVVVIAMLGNGESSSPSNTPDFPKKLDYRDCVRAQHELLTKHLGINSLDVVQGFSMGGQQAYYWACMYPSFVNNVIATCGSARTSLHNYAFIEGPKAALLNSVDYADGAYRANGTTPSRGLRAFGRAYCAWAMSTTWFRQRLFEKYGYTDLDAFIREQWEDKFETWDAEDLLILARMWQAGDIGTTHESGDYTKALEAIKARVLVMPSRTDQYFPPEDSETEMKYLKRGQLAVVETVWGHIAGGGANEEDTRWMDGRIKEFLK